MSNIHRSPSSLTLSTPDYDIYLSAYFTSTSTFISFLDIDYLGSLNNLPNLRNLDLNSSTVAFLTEKHNCTKLQKQFELIKGCQLLCSSKEDQYSSIFAILPKQNPFISTSHPCQYILINLKLELLLSTSPESYIIHIDNIKNSISNIQRKSLELSESLENESKISEKKVSELEILGETNNSIFTDLISTKRKVIELHKKFEDLEAEEAKCGVPLRCILCENNLKSIVFLPCGHILVCEECLVQNLKTEADAVLERRRKCLYCQTCKEKVKETRKMSFN